MEFDKSNLYHLNFILTSNPNISFLSCPNSFNFPFIIRQLLLFPILFYFLLLSHLSFLLISNILKDEISMVLLFFFSLYSYFYNHIHSHNHARTSGNIQKFDFTIAVCFRQNDKLGLVKVATYLSN